MNEYHRNGSSFEKGKKVGRGRLALLPIFLLLFSGGSMTVFADVADTLYQMPEPELVRERVFSEIPDSFYCPKLIQQEVAGFFGNAPLTIGAEFLYHTPEVFPKGDIVDIYNGMLGFSNMIGITFHSPRDKKDIVLVTESYRVQSPHSDSPLPDLVIDKPEPELKVFIRQSMHDFGKVLWEVNYRYEEGYIAAVLTNYEPIHMGIFKIVERGNMEVLIYAVPTGNDVIIYQTGKVYSAGMQILSFIGLKGYLEETFYYRMKAISAVYSAR